MNSISYETIWQLNNNCWCRKCPICKGIITHKGKYSKYRAIRNDKRGSKCHSCSMIGKSIPNSIRKKISVANSGKKFSESHKQNMSACKIGKQLSEETRKRLSEKLKMVMRLPYVRKKHLDALQKSMWLKVNTDIGQIEFLEKWNQLGFHFEPNYQVRNNSELFYVDGYDKQHGVVLEYDSKYHNKTFQKQKDLTRQQKIIQILNPKKFWRYNKTNYSLVNVLGS